MHACTGARALAAMHARCVLCTACILAWPRIGDVCNYCHRSLHHTCAVPVNLFFLRPTELTTMLGAGDCSLWWLVWPACLLGMTVDVFDQLALSTC